jgi:fermentation-respiration switch protein FrsA (DUF1100 family)
MPGVRGSGNGVDDAFDGVRPVSGTPRLIISGEKDNTVPWAVANASYKQQKDNPGLTEIIEIKGRGHALTFGARGEVAVAEADIYRTIRQFQRRDPDGQECSP